MLTGTNFPHCVLIDCFCLFLQSSRGWRQLDDRSELDNFTNLVWAQTILSVGKHYLGGARRRAARGMLAGAGTFCKVTQVWKKNPNIQRVKAKKEINTASPSPCRHCRSSQFLCPGKINPPQKHYLSVLGTESCAYLGRCMKSIYWIQSKTLLAGGEQSKLRKALQNQGLVSIQRGNTTVLSVYVGDMATNLWNMGGVSLETTAQNMEVTQTCGKVPSSLRPSSHKERAHW